MEKKLLKQILYALKCVYGDKKGLNLFEKLIRLFL